MEGAENNRIHCVWTMTAAACKGTRCVSPNHQALYRTGSATNITRLAPRWGVSSGAGLRWGLVPNSHLLNHPISAVYRVWVGEVGVLSTNSYSCLDSLFSCACPLGSGLTLPICCTTPTSHSVLRLYMSFRGGDTPTQLPPILHPSRSYGPLRAWSYRK